LASHKNSIYLSDQLQQYFDEQCEVFGMGKSAFFSMVLTMYKQQNQAINEFSRFDEYINRFEKIMDSKNNV